MSSEKRIHFVDAILNALVREADDAKQRFELLPRMPRSIPAECRTIWHDAAFSFIFGHYYGALSVCCAFVECLLAKTIPTFQASAGESQPSLPENLYGLINLAEKIGLVPTEEAAILQDLRQIIRNRFAHGDVDAVADSLMKLRSGSYAFVQDGEIKWRDLSADELKTMEEMTAAKRLEYAAKEFATPVMRWVGHWARRMGTVWKTDVPLDRDGTA
jgi:hypothetical protein